jgi:ABC-type protease/lipase transport system fused ATPase/permease subunit
MKTFEKVAAEFRGSLWMMALFSFVTNMLLLVVPLYMLQVYDRVLPSQSINTLIFLSLLAGLALVVLGLMEVVRSIFANRVANRLDAGLSELAMRAVIRSGAASGGNTQPIRDIQALRGLLSSKVVFAILDLPFATIFIVLLYFIHPDLFWLTLVGALVLCGVAVLNQMSISKASKESSDTAIASGQRAEFLARSADSLVAMGMVSNVIDRWGAEHAV